MSKHNRHGQPEDAAQDPHHLEENPVAPETEVQHNPEEQKPEEHKENVVSPEPLEPGNPPSSLDGPGATDEVSKQDQHEYDIARDADADALKENDAQEAKNDQEDHEKHSRKPNDIRHSENEVDSRKEVSPAAHSLLENHPHKINRVIGNNEYLLVTDEQVDSLPESAKEEIHRVHGNHRYKVPGHKHSPEYIAVPRKTVNTPQPFSGSVAGISKESHDDIFAKNVDLEKERTGQV